MINQNLPIGIFDSGLGGLTVLYKLARAFPTESFVYLGDLARLPYGNKSPETIRRYAEQVLNYLAQYPVKQLIIACNTASTVFLGEKFYRQIPLINVIEPGAQAAIEKTKKFKIGVLGTSTTINSHAYQKVLLALSPQAEVFEKACPLFVPLAEEGWRNDPITREIAARYVKDIKEQVDTVILGCTHYPILKTDIQQVLGNLVVLVESGDVLVQRLKSSLTPSTSTRSIKILTTDMTDQFKKLAQELMGEITIGQFERIVL